MAQQFSISPEKEASLSQYFYRQFFGNTPILTQDDVSLAGKTAIVTGSNTGLGLQVSRQLLDLGLSRLVLAVRDVDKGEAAGRHLCQGRAPGSCAVEVGRLDLSSYESIVEFSQRAKELESLDICVLNAGMFKATESFNSSTGFEDAVQVNYLSNALLMSLLLPILREKATSHPARLVLVSSDTAAWARFEERTSRPILATFKKQAASWDMQERYATSKLLGQVFVTELCRRVPSSVVTIDSANPGFCYGTELGREGNGTLLGFFVKMLTRLIGKSCEVGARSIVHAAAGFGEDVHGQYVEDGEIRP
ncbi:short-chain dehydrogenase/reductase [Ophiocordyceps camponoti-floridani]|uniref:Short-chain dehydrogenase/reductase n=1 Tax=Ophiocordyceps camponoti-floridani TaxID=2030778 RepID=A0A8H4QAD6_9HYPO|nr:short-chain dehydrogenase/reductase [Ophiocordyceps camponoti-floridani]